MSWLPRLQQRLSITKNEALTLLSLSLFLLVGTAGRYMCRQMRPVSAEYYAEFDSIFAARSAAALDAAEGADSDAGSSMRIPDGAGGAKPVHGDAAAPHGSTLGSAAEESAAYDGAGRSGSGKLNPSQNEPSDGSASTAAASASLIIDINQATADELDRLPRVGPKIAGRIIEFRSMYGRFQSVDELMGVRGIGATTLELIRPHARVGPPPESPGKGEGTAAEPTGTAEESTGTAPRATGTAAEPTGTAAEPAATAAEPTGTVADSTR